MVVGSIAAHPRNEGTLGSVDVLIAARNRADTIERAVQSALGQEETRAAIVVDDGSTDDTAARASRCDPHGNRVIVERMQSSLGPSAARNRALEISTAPWVAVLDADDFFLAERMAALLSSSDGWDLIADDVIQVQEDQMGTVASEPILFRDRHEPFALGLEQFALGNIRPHRVLRRELGFIKPIMRRSFLERHRLRYDESLRLGEDFALYARALAAGARFLIIPRPGYVSFWRADSLSARHSKEDLERLRDSDAELIATAKLTAREKRALSKHYASVDSRVQWLAVIGAFKSRQYRDFTSAFCRSPAVSKFLASRLLEEALRRTLKRVRSLVRTIMNSAH